MRWSLRLGVWWVLGAGCGAGVSCEKLPTLLAVEPECTEGSCNTGYVCVYGTCKLGCQEKSNCGKGYVCMDDFCQPGCSDKDDCGKGYSCEVEFRDKLGRCVQR